MAPAMPTDAQVLTPRAPGKRRRKTCSAKEAVGQLADRGDGQGKGAEQQVAQEAHEVGPDRAAGLLHNQKAAEGTEKNPDATALNTLDPRLALDKKAGQKEPDRGQGGQ